MISYMILYVTFMLYISIHISSKAQEGPDPGALCGMHKDWRQHEFFGDAWKESWSVLTTLLKSRNFKNHRYQPEWWFLTGQYHIYVTHGHPVSNFPFRRTSGGWSHPARPRMLLAYAVVAPSPKQRPKLPPNPSLSPKGVRVRRRSQKRLRTKSALWTIWNLDLQPVFHRHGVLLVSLGHLACTMQI